ncbi:MAG: DUF4435 domain-containing protein [Microcystaceae cyanobacterium]
MNVNDLIKAREEASNVPYQEFIKLVREYPNELFCFFEGKDNPYYYDRIKQSITLQINSVNCKGRKGVLKVHQLISYHPEYNKYKKAFFIDRDFNQPLPPQSPPVFETPCYSIENFYVSLEVFKEIMKNELHLSAVSDESYNICVQLFTDRQKEFHSAVILFNAWYACLIDIRNTKNIETGVQLDKKLPKGFIDFKLSSISSNYDLQKIRETFPNAREVTEESLNKKLLEFDTCEQHQVFRGKYEMDFLLSLIELILKDSRKSKNYIKDKIKFDFSERISHEQALNIFSRYAETPESLKTYIRKISE